MIETYRWWKNKGPNQDFWGTPDDDKNFGNLRLRISTNYLRNERYDLSRLYAYVIVPSLLIMISWSSLSNALLKSVYTTYIWWPASRASLRYCVKHRMLVVVSEILRGLIRHNSKSGHCLNSYCGRLQTKIFLNFNFMEVMERLFIFLDSLVNHLIEKLS